MQRYPNKIFYLRLIADLVILNAAFLLSALVAEQIRGVSVSADSLYILAILNIIWYVTARGINLYDEFRTRGISTYTAPIMKSVVVQVLALVVLLFLFREILLSRYLVVGYAFFLAFGLVAGKAVIRSLLKTLRKRGRSIRRMVIVGALGEFVIRYLCRGKFRISNNQMSNVEQLESANSKFVIRNSIFVIPSAGISNIEQLNVECRTVESTNSRFGVRNSIFVI